MIYAKALVTKALLFGLLTATYALPAPQDSSSVGDGQKPVKSLGEIAKEARKDKPAHAKTVITDENLDVKRGPLPKLNLEGPENFDAIVQAIGDYKAKHSRPGDGAGAARLVQGVRFHARHNVPRKPGTADLA